MLQAVVAEPRECKNIIIIARKRSLGQGDVFTPVCDSVHKGDICPIACWDIHPLPQTHPCRETLPKADTSPPRQTHTPGQTTPRILRDTVNKQAVRILLECILVYQKQICPFTCKSILVLKIGLFYFLSLGLSLRGKSHLSLL